MPALPPRPPSNPKARVAPPGGGAAPTSGPAIPFSAKEEDVVFAAILTQEQREDLAKVDAKARTRLRDLSRSLRNLNHQASDLKKRRTDLTKEWLAAIETTKLAVVPCMDPVSREPLLAYKRSDEMMTVNPTDLREFLDEHFRITKGEDAELAATHVLDIMGQVLKPEAIDNEIFKKLVEEQVIDGQVAAACTVISNKEPYVAFLKANANKK